MSPLDGTMLITVRTSLSEGPALLTYLADYEPSAVISAEVGAETLTPTAQAAGAGIGRHGRVLTHEELVAAYRYIWDGCHHWGNDHTLALVIEWWAAHPDDHPRLSQLARSIDRDPKSIMSMMRTLRKLCRKVGIDPERFYGSNRRGMGVTGDVAAILSSFQVS